MAQVKSIKKNIQSTSLFGGIDTARLKRIWKPFWINYPEGTRVLTHLEWIFKQPKSYRTQCSLIIADPAAGKTAIAKQFVKTMNPPQKQGEEDREIPVVYAQAPPNGTAAGLYTNILRAVHAPYQSTWHVPRKQDQVLHMLTKLKTRMLIVDELHAMLAGNVHDRSIFMSVLKFLSSELQIPIVGIGTKEALRAMHTDEQFANRFEPFRVEKWSADENYVHFMTKVCRHAGFKDTALLRRKPFVRHVHTLSKGLTGETWKLICRLIEYAETEGTTKLTMEMLDNIVWTTPGERRWAASRNIKQEKTNGTDTRENHGASRCADGDELRQEARARIRERGGYSKF